MTQRTVPATNTVAPAPGRLPLVGHAFGLRKGLLGYLKSLPSDTDMVRLQIGPWLQPILVCNPDLIHHIHVNSQTFDRGGPLIDKFVDVVGNGLGTCPWAEHRRQRRILQPLFRNDHLAAYAPTMSQQAGALMDRWHDGQVIDVPAHANDYTSRLLAKTLFTADLATPAVDAMVESASLIRRGIYTRAFIPARVMGIVHKLPIAAGRDLDQAHHRIRAVIGRTIQEYRRSNTDHGDLLSMLLAARDEDGTPLDDQEIHYQVISFMIAGFDTTAAALSWALDLLARHPDIRDRLHSEVDTVLAGGLAGWDNLPELDLTRRIVTETLRVCPPAWLLDRHVIRDTELGGHLLPAGTPVLYSPYFVHHSHAYFPDPERFDPDRWLPERKHETPRNAFIPFGAGPRKCIADTFATTAVTIALASIAARWRVDTTTADPPQAAASLVYSPRTLHMRLHHRTP
ncbi:cytochrome P450 [Nocardia colli]|uniref:Cytochrome P450 n=1 Tax=Nocardia colli TaxID=2545717 RepID=A0A5N0EFL0_9NOCA|nr:cytochrome P450 [Nocardia colli]